MTTETAPSRLRNIEAVLFIGSEATTASVLARVLPGIDDASLRQVVEVLNVKYERQERPYRIVAADGGWRMRLLPEYSEWVRERIKPARSVKLGRPALEVLSAIAYKQPISRPALEALVGSDAGPPLRKLLRMRLIEQTGVEETEATFRTTERFLEAFKIAAPAELPVVEGI